jgi:monofunctional biosynthetic peptidoglycan transglycosylase
MKTPLTAVVTLVTSVSVVAIGEEDVRDMESTGRTVVDLARTQESSWQAINDGVMGGLSQSQLSGTSAGTAVFMGVVSLENNGGFASVRMSLDEADLSEYDGLALRVLGDGKRYRLRLRSEDRSDAVAYQATFDTAGDVWQVVEIPFASFLPTYRGRTPRDAPPLDISKIRQIGFMIAGKQEGRFRLEIAWVRARKAASGGQSDQ